MKIINFTKEICNRIYSILLSFYRNLNRVIFIILIFFILLIIIKNSYFNIDYYNNACSSVLQVKQDFCYSWLTLRLFLIIPEFFFYLIIVLFFIVRKKAEDNNDSLPKTKWMFLWFLIILFLFYRFFTISASITPLLSFGYDNFIIIWNLFLWLFLIIFIISNSNSKEYILLKINEVSIETSKEKKIEKDKENQDLDEVQIQKEEEEQNNKREINSSLLPILESILYNNFSEKTRKNNENIPDVVRINNIIFEKPYIAFIDLKLISSLFENIDKLSKFDWTLGINSNGFLKNFQKAKWKSDSWKNGLVVTFKKNTIDFSKTISYPFLFEVNPFLKNPLEFIYGQNEDGIDRVYDLATMPHLLVAWETWWWKSVIITNILVSLMKNKCLWKQISFYIIDPKIVEFSLYSDLHWFNIVTDNEKAVGVLAWLDNEMEKRYNFLKDKWYKKISEYHEEWWKMDYIVLIIDEFADIMTSWKDISKSAENYVVRLIQKARAIGIHIIIATQNPVWEVITSNIKANLTSRLGLKATDPIKSNTIIGSWILSTIQNPGETYMKLSESDIEHIKGYFIDNKTLLDFIEYYTSKVGISKKADPIEKLSENVISYIIENNGYSWRELFKKDCGVTEQQFRIISSYLKNEKGIVVYSEKDKINVLNQDIDENLKKILISDLIEKLKNPIK